MKTKQRFKRQLQPQVRAITLQEAWDVVASYLDLVDSSCFFVSKYNGSWGHWVLYTGGENSINVVEATNKSVRHDK